MFSLDRGRYYKAVQGNMPKPLRNVNTLRHCEEIACVEEHLHTSGNSDITTSGTHCLRMHDSPGFPGKLGIYCIYLRVARSYIAGSLESSHAMAVSSGKEAAFNQAV